MTYKPIDVLNVILKAHENNFHAMSFINILFTVQAFRLGCSFDLNRKHFATRKYSRVLLRPRFLEKNIQMIFSHQGKENPFFEVRKLEKLPERHLHLFDLMLVHIFFFSQHFLQLPLEINSLRL